MRHYDVTGPDAVHEVGFVQPADPLFDSENPLETGMAWYDTTEGRLKFRNPENNGWLTPGVS